MSVAIRHSPDSTRWAPRSMVRPSSGTPANRGTETVVSMHDVAGWIRPWVTKDRRDTLDSLAMDARDRTVNLGFFAAAGIAWLLVGFVVTTRDPVTDSTAGFLGAALIGLAIALTLIPVLWLTVFGRHGQIAYRGDWVRAIRRAAWVGIVVAVLIVLRVQGLLELPIALFMIALAVVAEATLSAER